MNKKGFTLIELLIVIAIIGILAMIAIPAYIGQQRSATRSEAYSNLQSFRLLEEQFMAENGAYTINLGSAGNTTAIRDANLLAIQAAGALPKFRPGADGNFSYRVIPNVALPAAVTVPYNGVTVVQTPCFVAVAEGVVNTRVAGEVFAIDCNNNRNF